MVAQQTSKTAQSKAAQSKTAQSKSPVLDSQRVDWTRRQLRKLVLEIVQLAKSDLPAERFFPDYLRNASEVLAATGAAVWSIDSAGKLQFAHEREFPRAALGQRNAALRHERLIRHVIESGVAVVVAPGEELAAAPGAANPTDKLLLAVPLRCDQRIEGVLELLLAAPRSGAAPGVQNDSLRMAVHLATLAGEWLRRQGLRRLSDRAKRWQQFDTFALAVHDVLDVRQAAFTIANEGRRLIECDRASVVVARGRRLRVEAVSGQDTFDPRSNVIQLQSQLAERVMDLNETIYFEGNADEFAPDVAELLADYAEETGVRAVAMIPLRGAAQSVDETQGDAAVASNVPATNAQAANAQAAVGPAVGALVLDLFDGAVARELLMTRAEPVAAHAGRAVAAALEHENVLWLPFWKLLSRHRLTRRARYAPRWKWALGIVATVGLLLAVVPARFSVEGQAVLQPASQRNVFAALDGVVNAVYVEHGDLVKAGEVIAELRNTDLDVRIAELLGQRRAAQEQLSTTQRMRHDTKLAAEERDRLSGQVQQVEEQLRGLEEQYKLLTAKREQLVVRSPITGRVITWNVRRQLLHRPVVTGQTLVTVADVTGPWELEVYLPESRLGHLAAARESSEAPLSVEYLLTSDPTVRRQGTVRAVDASAQLHEPYGHGVRVLVDIDAMELERPKSGTTASAKIDCGRRPLGYVWLHGAIEFVQTHVLFKLS